jgi:hypothetical protein
MSARVHAREPSFEDVRAALSSKESCEEMFGPLSRDDIIDYFEQSVVMGSSEGTKAVTITRDPETGGEIESEIDQAVAVPLWMLAQAAVLLKTARPGRKQSMSAREQRIRYYAERIYQRKKQELGSADEAASYVSNWLGTKGIQLSKQSILKGALSRRHK